MAQYVYTMQGVTKVVPPQRTILQNINLSFFPGAKIGVLGLNSSRENPAYCASWQAGHRD